MSKALYYTLLLTIGYKLLVSWSNERIIIFLSVLRIFLQTLINTAKGKRAEIDKTIAAPISIYDHAWSHEVAC